MTAPVLIFGSSGQLARELARLDADDQRIVCVGRDVCDLASGTNPDEIIAKVSPALVINAAAYTAVDRAESDAEAAYALNRDAPGAIARTCADRDLPFLHISTDYVFDGAKGAPYLEDDARNPLGVYGTSKAAGEDAMAATGGRWAVARLGWLYSAFGTNFPKTMLRLAETRDEIAVVADQIGRPTSARFVAAALLALGEKMIARDPAAIGLFHLAPRGEASWADFAETVFARSTVRGGRSARVTRIATADYPTAARRPVDSRLDATRLEVLLGARFPDWREPLDALIDDLMPAKAPVRA